jgi:hypothetical protein
VALPAKRITIELVFPPAGPVTPDTDVVKFAIAAGAISAAARARAHLVIVLWFIRSPCPRFDVF